MMGHGYTGGYQPQPRQSVIKKYAWFPIKLSNDKWVWCTTYYQINTYYDENGKPPIKMLCWTRTITKNEYLVWMIKNPTQHPVPPNSKRAVSYYAEF